MVSVIDLVADEDRLLLVAEKPDAVVRRLARPEIPDCEAQISELDPLPVSDRLVRERAFLGPLCAKHGAQNLLLDRVVAADHCIDSGSRDHVHLVRAHELDDAAVMIRMSVRNEHRQERLAERLDLRSGVRARPRP